jgi:hypothetical protein
VGILRTAATIANPTTGASLSYRGASVSDELIYGSGIESPAVSTPFVTTTTTADGLASYLANTSNAISPLVTIALDVDSDAQAAVVRDIDLNQRVYATESVTGTTLDAFVEQVTHRISNGGLSHTCTISVSARARMVGIYSPGTDPVGATVYALSAYTAANPAEPPPYATYGF